MFLSCADGFRDAARSTTKNTLAYLFLASAHLGTRSKYKPNTDFYKDIHRMQKLEETERAENTGRHSSKLKLRPQRRVATGSAEEVRRAAATEKSFSLAFKIQRTP